MSTRKKINQRKAKKRFVAVANRHHPKNSAPAPMRGGYRL